MTATTVLFAASDSGHRHHRPSLDLVAKARRSTSFVAAHSLAELYATLSGVPSPRMRRLDRVLEAVEQASRQFTPIALNVDDYMWVLIEQPQLTGNDVAAPRLVGHAVSWPCGTQESTW